MIPEMLGSIKTGIIMMLDERYTVVASIVSTTTTVNVVDVVVSGERKIPYPKFNNTKPPDFDGFMEPIVFMRWISDVEGCFYTCTYPANLKFIYAQNPLCLGEKGWCNFVTKNYSPVERNTVTWEQYVEKFREEYVVLVERDQPAQEHLALK